MNKGRVWKIGLVVFLVVFAMFHLWPSLFRLEFSVDGINLKPGLDLAGGTSLIYDIDTTGLEGVESEDLAQRMIPILLKRIDPTNVANIVMRPQGDTRIEIQLPLASVDSVNKRKAYDKALAELEEGNLNLLKVKRALLMDDAERQEAFAGFAGESEATKTILDNLVSAYDQRKEKQQQRDDLAAQMESLMEAIGADELTADFSETMAQEWSGLEGAARKKAIAEFIISDDEGDKQDAEGSINNYMAIFDKWAEVVNEITTPETGIDAKWFEAIGKLGDLNIGITQMTDVLELAPDSSKRREHIEGLKTRFPDRAQAIDAVVEAYSKYGTIAGRLDDPEDLKRMLRGAGVLEFRILPAQEDAKVSAGELAGYLEAFKTKGPKLASDSRYTWCQIENPESFRKDAIVATFGEKTYVLASNQPGESMLHGGERPWKLKKSYPSTDQMGRRAIGFTHDEIAASLFFNITKNNINRPLCILLDGVAFSAPNINSAIRGSGIIEGTFTQVEQSDMIDKLNAGSFPARLSEVPISEKSVGPMIGADNRDKGIKAGVYGLAAVAVFMLVYYIGCGFIADIALMLNMLFVLGMMSMFDATFTLPGIAGLILTIGMSVDANVLIFERVREEQDRGSSLRTAIANGYKRAFRTIFDANITTFGVAMILYMVASEEIKGFAIVLMLGIVSSMFTALFVTRVVFDLLVDKRIIRDHLRMLKVIRNPSVDWMALRRVFVSISVVLIGTGMFVFFSRDDSANSKYDIEFTGGTSVQISLKKGTAFDRQIVEDKIRQQGLDMNNDALAVARVYSVGEGGNEFEINTTETNKTSATVTFSDSGRTVESVTADIEKAMEQLADRLYNLRVVGSGDKAFVVSTSQVNKALVEKALNTAFAGVATVSSPEVDEVVSKAVRKAFAGLLELQEDLGAAIDDVEEITDATVELTDFIGGVKITCNLEKHPTTEELQGRFNDILFKPDTKDLARYQYRLLNPELAAFEDGDEVAEFVYVSVHPEAGLRDLSENEWTRFVENERTKVLKAASLTTSLSRVTQVDPSIGQQAKTRALIAIAMSLAAIVAYIWIRFGDARYGFAAIVALVHDVCITLGAVTVCTYIADTPIGRALLLQDFKINLQMIAAFLTIIGYSLNDTIVVFDRIRENRGKLATLNPQMISNSINQTLSRTLLTSVTTFMVVLVMYIWGGTGLRGFTFAMLIGIIAGTYSSIAIAAPILLLGTKVGKLRK